MSMKSFLESTRRAQTATTSSAVYRRAWIVTLLLTAFMFINFADKVVVGIVGVEIQQDLDISSFQFGLLQSTFFWLFALGAVTLGMLGGRVDSRWLLTGLVGVWVLSLIPLTGLIPVTFSVVLLGRMALGFAEGPAFALANQITHTWFVPSRRSFPSSVVNMGASLGPLIAAPVLTWVMQRHGWQACFHVLILLGVVWLALWMRYGTEGPAASAPPDATTPDSTDTDRRPETVPWRALWARPTVYGFAIFSFCSYCATSLKVTWLPVYFRQGLQYSASTTGFLITLPFASAAIFGLLAGLLSGRMMARGASSRAGRGLPAAGLLMVGGICMITFPQLPAGAVQIVLLTLAFSLNTAAWGIAFSMLSDVVPARQRSSVMGIVVAVYSLGGAAAPLVLGILVSGSAAHGYHRGFIALGAVMVVGAITMCVCANPRRDSDILTGRYGGM
ncbi:MFS transporter [Mycobacterium sp. NPDC003449]